MSNLLTQSALTLPNLEAILAEASRLHRHLCPRQVLGARIGLAGAEALELAIPRRDKRLLVLVETDGCFVSGVVAATGCLVNRRTLRVVDYGKIAATFVDVKTETAVRVAPHPDVRERVWPYAPGERRRYFAMLRGYQVMPTEALLQIQSVRLTQPLQEMVSRPGVRTRCTRCNEEIINEREVIVDGEVRCIACAGPAYYRPP